MCVMVCVLCTAGKGVGSVYIRTYILYVCCMLQLMLQTCLLSIHSYTTLQLQCTLNNATGRVLVCATNAVHCTATAAQGSYCMYIRTYVSVYVVFAGPTSLGLTVK